MGVTTFPFPTKSNLVASIHSLELAKIGYELMDRKRSILLREMMSLMRKAEGIQEEIDVTFSKAYAQLQKANYMTGQNEIIDIVNSRNFNDDVTIQFRSIMGVEIPEIKLDKEVPSLYYGFARTNSALDEAYISFLKVKELSAVMVAIENSVYKLAYAIKQAQKRANALRNIIIPQLEETIAYITNYLEEKEREAFAVLKVTKKSK